MDNELSEFISRLREKYKQSFRMRRLVSELNKIATVRDKRKLTSREIEKKWLLWEEVEYELS